MALIKSTKHHKLLKRSIAVVIALVIIIFGLHLWFVYNARTALKNYIAEESNGKIKLELSELKLNLLSNHLQVRQANLISTDSVNESITYNVKFSKISLNVGSLWELLFKKKLLLDSIKLYNPVIQVMQWRKDTSSGAVVKDELSIPQEMGKIYNSMLDALNKFGVRRIVIDNAMFSLVNKMKPGSEPVTVSKVFFDLARKPVKEGKKNVYRENEHTIDLRVSDQNIVLPGGRHRLAFKSLNLHLYRESIELDSCTVAAVATDSLKSNYKIFFKKLSLTGVDFAALSTQNIIAADSVYCEDPYFDFNLYRSDAVAKKTERPDPNKIIRELTGNLNLGFVGVKNAGINLDIYSKTKRSFTNANKDNFEMHELRINPDSSSPVTVKQFNMTLRDYALYNEDSSSVYSFDSLRFINNRIALNNFAVFSGPGAGRLRNNTDIKIPYFELTQLDWYQLVFEQNLVAREAFLNDPVINFSRRRPAKKGKKLDLFATLLSLDSLVALEKVSVKNGKVNMQFGPATSFNVQKINFNIYTNRLLNSKNREGLRSAVEHLSFSKGVLRIKDITAQLQNARYTGNNLIYADKVLVSAKGNKVTGTINNVYLNNMLLDDDAETIEVDGLGWKSATVAIRTNPAAKKAKGKGSINLKNLAGNNTRLSVSGGPTTISTFINTLTAASLTKSGAQPLRVEGLGMEGNNLSVNTNAVKLSADAYNISGEAASWLTGVQVAKIKGRDTLNVTSPRINFSADPNDLFANNLHLANVAATAPVIKIINWDSTTAEDATSAAALSKPPIRIDNFTATDPDIQVATYRNDSVAVISIPKSGNSNVRAAGIIIAGSSFQLGSLVVNSAAATFIKPSGEVMGVERGKIDIDLANIQVDKRGGKMNWAGFINTLSIQNANGLQIGKNKNNLRFQNVSVGNVSLSSELLPDFGQLMKKNVSAWLRIPQGEFIDSNTTIQWYNANYNNSTRTLKLDSFIYHPTQPRDSVLAHAPYQLDYMTVKTGAVTIDGLDVERYERDSSFIANSMTITDPFLNVYRDKTPPVSPIKKDKPLPVNLLKNMALPVAVQTLNIVDGNIVYSEKNGKTGKEGSLFLTNVNAALDNIKNNNLKDGDSLGLVFKASLMDSAHISLNLKESYTDTLGSFLLNAKVSGANLAVLNPILVPFLNVRISSGVLDSLSYTAVGRDDIAYGKMNMPYRKLRIELIKEGEEDRSTLARKALSFLVNTFVIKRNNTGREGLIYYERLPNKSFVNYIIKTTLSGLTTSVGAKKNRKVLQQYQKKVKESGQPIKL